MAIRVLRLVAPFVVALAACVRSASIPAAPGSVPVGPSAPRIRVMTFNIAAGRFGLDAVAATIREARADVVGLQEVDVNFAQRSGLADQAKELADALGMHAFFAPIYTLPPAAEGRPPRRFGVAVLSRLPIVSARNREITRLSTQEPDPIPRRMPGLAEVRVRVGTREVRVLDTHLDYRSDPAVRRAQVSDLLAALGPADSLPTILLGDLNAPPHAAELRPLLERLADAWQASASHGTGATYPASAPARRIDYVLVGAGVAVLSIRVLATPASDHRPVVADLSLP